MSLRTYFLASLMLAGLSIRPAQAELIIDIGSASLAPGSTKTIDVLISSNATDATPDMLNQYGLQLLITTAGSTRLEFGQTQPQGFLNDSTYVFYSNSFSYDFSISASSIATTFVTNDTFNAGDSTSNASTISLSQSSGQKLLAQFQVTSDTTLPPLAGDTFTISLVPSSGTGSASGNASTYFDNYDFDTGKEISSVSFRSNPGTVTIQPVPEPSSLILSLISLGGLLLLRPFLFQERLRL